MESMSSIIEIEGLEGLSEEKLLTAKYLTACMMYDPYFVEHGADMAWISGVVANMLIEGKPGQMENYMQKANPNEKEEYAKTIK